ncbi:MAG: FAD-dependent tricarballylate dehydrogenase TcuA [Natronomonas sp.]|jgi:tricarballylate dehydrogenase|uniref:FAD-dependent tricarballylate dehydrogenase TcuA n=1 Tax=Natronomonas sp. TaxID=2184060 RepID=UPI0028703C64|nr:FAD-dependent tricarballylate dehydrogenase TcuA [Natronomonas sp.]MDR9429915.1 FAD-dependent tricarballylate dehydrogenase TcuA [Natronomonas sp.]
MNEERYDVVIVGCGVAGLTAGLRASELGASVCVLEKSPKKHRGGHTRFTESFRIPAADIDLDVEFNVPDYTSSDFYSDIMNVTDYRADPDLAEEVANGSAETFEWLTAHGIDWEYQAPHPGYTAGRVWLDGEQFVDELVELVEDEGGEFFYEAEARSLLRTDAGRTVGVEARVEGEATRFEGEAVILAAGDYGSSKEKRTRYYGPGYGNMKVRGSRYNTGEAIEAAMDVGAKSDGEWGDAHMALIDAGSPDVEGGITRIDGYQYGLIINHDGERFVDEGEDARAHTYAKFGRRIFEQPYHEAFIIVDSKVVDDVAHMGPSRAITGDTIESLANRLGIEKVDKAVETVEAYNAACDPDAVDSYDANSLDGNATEGLDLPKSNWALALDEPPYTGYPVTGGMTFAFGGVATNTDAEVLDTRDDPIPGLYGAGNATGGLFYGNYPGGTGLTNAAVFGKIAAENAVDDVQN